MNNFDTDQKTVLTNSSNNKNINIKKLLIETLTNFKKKTTSDGNHSSLIQPQQPQIEKIPQKPQYQTNPHKFENMKNEEDQSQQQNKTSNQFLFQLYNQNIVQ